MQSTETAKKIISILNSETALNMANCKATFIEDSIKENNKAAGVRARKSSITWGKLLVKRTVELREARKLMKEFRAESLKEERGE